MVISVTPLALHRFVVPFTVAPVKFTVPKLVSGRTLPLVLELGASAITSADDRTALATAWV
jgi:hypothetical protein